MKNEPYQPLQVNDLPPRLAVELPVSDYNEIHQLQLAMVAARQSGELDRDVIFVLEHHPVYTIGRNGSRDHLIEPSAESTQKKIPLIRIERGGEITYHGPGQVVGYPIIELKRANLSVKGFVAALEEIMIRTAADVGITADRKAINPGIWVAERKLGSVGVAVRRGIAFHGFALNVNLDLGPFDRINPCGLAGVRMTSLEKEKGQPVQMAAVRKRIWHHLTDVLRFQTDFVALSSLPGREPVDEPVRRSTTQSAAEKSRLQSKLSAQPLPRPSANGPTSQPANHLQRKPKWLRRRLPSGPAHEKVRNLIHTQGLHTVCQQAKCPNQFECFSQQTATFLILGDRCTRNCGFCHVLTGPDRPPDLDEPRRVAQAVQKMNLQYVVITSVTRDDLPDGGAAHFAATIQQVRQVSPHAKVEVLIPDFQGDGDALKTVLAANPDVLNHNIETVSRLYSIVRPQADYGRSLQLLRRVARHLPVIPSKSGLMLGLGETVSETKACLRDIQSTGCRLLTLGQYLQPSPAHLPVARFIPPEEFDAWRETALKMGFDHVASGPFVRSSYHAKELYPDT